MARLVVVEFSDNEEAERFAEENRDTVWVVDGTDGNARARSDDSTWCKVQVLGLFGFPTTNCTCSGRLRGKNRVMAWTRGKKYGWWVHSCGKPSKQWGSNIQAVIADGINLLFDTGLRSKEE